MMNAGEGVSQGLRESLTETQDIVFVKDLEGRYLMVNEAAAGVVGLTPDELIGRRDVEILAPEVAEQQREYDRELVRRGEPITFQGPLVVDGEPRTFRTTKAPLRDAHGEVIGVIGVSTDITALSLAEEALRKSQAQLAEAQALTAVGSWDWHLPDDRRNWSEQLYRIYGRDPADGPMTWEEFLGAVHPDDREWVRKDFEEAMASGSHWELTHRIVREDGEERILSCAGDFFRDVDGTVVRAIGASQDITEREREIELRREREAQLNAAQELTGVGSWEWDLATDTVEWSENLYRIFGLKREEFGATYAAYLEAVHPEDRETRRADIERILETGEPYTDEHRIVRPNGEVRTIEATAMLVVDSSGRKRLIGACQDVTELRRSERELTRRALLDPLTQLGNRALAYDRLTHALQVAQRRGSSVAVLYLDIDGFKAINDEFGHAAGDEVLREVAERLGKAVRESDTLARHGGDEFLVVCEDVEEATEAEQITQRVRECFSEEFEVGGERRRLAVSVGMAFAGRRSLTAEQLIGEADAAMYREKGRRPTD